MTKPHKHCHIFPKRLKVTARSKILTAKQKHSFTRDRVKTISLKNTATKHLTLHNLRRHKQQPQSCLKFMVSSFGTSRPFDSFALNDKEGAPVTGCPPQNYTGGAHLTSGVDCDPIPHTQVHSAPHNRRTFIPRN